MSFDPSNRFLKISEVHQKSNSQSVNPLGSVWAHSLTLSRTPKNVNVTLELHSRPAPFHAPCLGHEPKVKVVTIMLKRKKNVKNLDYYWTRYP
jgi:hypothetical protein